MHELREWSKGGAMEVMAKRRRGLFHGLWWILQRGIEFEPIGRPTGRLPVHAYRVDGVNRDRVVRILGEPFEGLTLACVGG